LGAYIIAKLIDKTGIDKEEIEDVYFGCTNQAGEDSRNVARNASLLAELPYTIPGATVNRLCGSGLERSTRLDEPSKLTTATFRAWVRA